MMFAPFYLMDAFAGAQIVHDSVQRPLVSGKELIVDALPEEEEGGWMPTPFQCSLLLLYLPQLLLSTASAKGQDSGVSTLFYSVPQASWAVCWPSSPYSPNIRLSAPISYCWYSIRDSFCSFHTSLLCPKRKEMLVFDAEFSRFNTFYGAFPLIPQRFDLAVVPLALCLLIRSASNLILTSKKK